MLFHALSVSDLAKAGHPVFQRLLSKNSGVSGILDRPVKCSARGHDRRVFGDIADTS
jgi:hypothetical protein